MTILKKFLAIPAVKNVLQVIIRVLFISLVLLSFSLRWAFVTVKNILIAVARTLLILPILFSLILRWTVTVIKKVLRWTVAVIKKVPWLINWIFAIGFIVFGIVLLETFLTAGAILIVVGILISPSLNRLFQKVIHTSFSMSTKIIIAFSGIMIIIISSAYYETDEKLFLTGFLARNAWLDYEDEKQLHQLRESFKEEELKQREQTYLATHDSLLSDLQFFYDNNNSQMVVNEGAPYLKFDSQIDYWVFESQTKLDQQYLEMAQKEAPQLLKAGKYREAYNLAAPLLIPQLQKVAASAQKRIDKEFAKLLSWYERGHYKRVIKKGMPHFEIDCRVRKLVSDAQTAQAKVDERRRFNKVIKKISDLIKQRRYEKAIKFAQQSKYADSEEIHELIERARLQRKKDKERRILARLRNIPPTHIEANIREYTKLLKIFPNNAQYQRKLENYKRKLVELRKQPPLLITKEKYGDKWPFTISKGKLECFPPGIVIFRTNDQAYAINALASSRGYKDINEIWKNDGGGQQPESAFTKIDTGHIINKGLELCNP